MTWHGPYTLYTSVNMFRKDHSATGHRIESRWGQNLVIQFVNIDNIYVFQFLYYNYRLFSLSSWFVLILLHCCCYRCHNVRVKACMFMFHCAMCMLAVCLQF